MCVCKKAFGVLIARLFGVCTEIFADNELSELSNYVWQ